MTRSLRTISNYRTLLLSLAVMMASLFFISACGDDEVANQQACKFDIDCALGTVCGANESCVSAACDFCTAEQICYKTPANPEGSCSAPQCTSPSDCDGNPCVKGQCQAPGTGGDVCNKDDDCPDPATQTCTLGGKCIDDPSKNTKECEDSTQCTGTKECDANNKCVEPPCTAESCGEGKICGENGECADAPVCNPEACEPNERCLPSTGACGIDCISDGTICAPNQKCDKPTGTCVEDPCPSVNPDSCTGNTPHLSSELGCSCVQCTDNDHCGPGKVCGPNGACTAGECAKECDSSQPGTCNGAPGTPYCINNCCSECIGAADCSGGQLCLDGFCGNPPNCDTDPSVCPQGYSCEAGTCKPPAAQACSEDDPLSCPPGTFCDGQNCQNAGGDFGCGLCNPDCTCPNGLTCNGFVCEGCTWQIPKPIGPGSQCPEGQLCDIILTNMCFPW